jgi:protein-S-isoprenylcysteine O-methyltransferase Ste14
MTLSTIAAYALIVGFLAMERWTRQGLAAKSLEAGRFDLGSTRRLGVAFAAGILGLLLAPVLNALQLGALRHRSVGWVGVGLMVAGLTLRYWAGRILGRFYTRTLRVADDQVLVERGPYRMIRHPGYSADLLMWGGAGLATVNGIVATVLVLVMVWSYRYRIECEEAMLLVTLAPHYQSYRERTWRLIPYIY